MHDVFRKHYHQHPGSRFSHIPSIPVTIPVDLATQHDFCYTARYLQQPQTVSPKDVRNTAAALLHAVQELEPDEDAQSIQETNQESSGRPVRKYFVKRNYSGEAKPSLCRMSRCCVWLKNVCMTADCVEHACSTSAEDHCIYSSKLGGWGGVPEQGYRV